MKESIASIKPAWSVIGDENIIALSLLNGRPLWQKAIARTDCTPAIANGRSSVCGGTDGFSDKAAYCSDAVTGETVWNTSDKEGIGEWRCSPAYADGLLFVKKTENTPLIREANHHEF